MVIRRNKNEVMTLNDLGQIVEKCWHEIPKHFSHVSLDAFIVMPNHIHGILTLNTSGRGIAPVQDHEGRGIACNAPTDAVIMKANEIPSSPQIFGKSSPGTLPVIVRAFKSATTRHINRLRNSPATPIWQRNYYEHAIRNNEELQKSACISKTIRNIGSPTKNIPHRTRPEFCRRAEGSQLRADETPRHLAQVSHLRGNYGSTLPGLIFTPFSITSKCRCGPVYIGPVP